MFKRSNNYSYIKPEVKKPIIPGVILIFTIIIGTAGYYLLWLESHNASLIDAFYMTVITITTLGYAEIYPLGDIGRMFTIIIATAGIGSLFFILTITMENLFILQIHHYGRKKKMIDRIEHISNHVILIGFGRVGQLAAKELMLQNEKFVVIDDDFREEDILHQKDLLLRIKGNATDDITLLRAGIERARGLIVATGNAATTVFVVLSARVLNPKIHIVARSDDFNNTEKLIRAGADRVVNPFSIGGQRLANLIINPHVIDFFETTIGNSENKLSIENIELPESCIWIGKTLKDMNVRQKTGVTILAVIRNGKAEINPRGDFELMTGDQLVALGTREQLTNLEELAISGK